MDFDMKTQPKDKKYFLKIELWDRDKFNPNLDRRIYLYQGLMSATKINKIFLLTPKIYKNIIRKIYD